LNSKKENININNDKNSNLDNNMFNKIKNNIINNAISFYIGDLNINNIPNGYGILYEKSGYRKEGFFQNGIFTGWNNLYNNNNKIQQIGYFNNNEILNNYGYSYNLTNKIIYKGNFKNNLKEGEGEEKNNEYLYKGNFINDKKNGNGKIIYNYSGDIYEGNFKDDLFEGNGHYVYNQTGEDFRNLIVNSLDGANFTDEELTQRMLSAAMGLILANQVAELKEVYLDSQEEFDELERLGQIDEDTKYFIFEE
jgi:hypothetical protein